MAAPRLSQSLAAWRAAVTVHCEHVRSEGRGLRFAPCPACGGGSRDTAWARPGRRGIVAGCNAGCDFEALARALWPDSPGARRGRRRGYASDNPRRPQAKPKASPRGEGRPPPPTPAAAVPGGPGEGARFADFAAAVERLPPQDAARRWIEGRGLDPGRLEAAGWRSASGPDALALARRHGCTLPRLAARARAVLLIPTWDGDGRALSVRARPLDPPGKTMTLPGDVGRLYGLDALLLPPGGVLHICEGETDTEALRAAGAVAVTGLPGAQSLHGEAVDVARSVAAARVALWMDGDPAGREAADALADRLRAAGLDVQRWRFPAGMDAGDAWRADPTGLRLAVASISTLENPT